MPAAITEFRQQVKTIVEDEFAPEGLTVRNDKLHDSLGWDGAVSAVYPSAEAPGDATIVQNMLVVVQVFQRYELNVDPEQRVDPAKIEEWAWRLQRAFKQDMGPGTEKVWYWNVAHIEYPDDPTGNKTRFVMSLEGYTSNASLIETTD